MWVRSEDTRLPEVGSWLLPGQGFSSSTLPTPGLGSFTRELPWELRAMSNDDDCPPSTCQWHPQHAPSHGNQTCLRPMPMIMTPPSEGRRRVIELAPEVRGGSVLLPALDGGYMSVVHFKVLAEWTPHVVCTFLRLVLVGLIGRTLGGVPGHQMAPCS